MSKIVNNIDLIVDTLVVISGLLFSFLAFGVMVIEKRVFDYYESYSQGRNGLGIEKKPFRITTPLDLQYFFKPLPSKEGNPHFYQGTK